MAKLFDADGKEVEAFTPEELEAKKKEALDAYIAANPDKSSEITKLQADLKEANDKITAGAGGDSGQVLRLKNERDDIEKNLTEKIDAVGKEFKNYRESITGNAKEKALTALTGGDKDLRAKVELKMANLTGYPDTPEGTQAKIQDAFTMATGNRPTPAMLDGITGAGARGDGSGTGPTTGPTENGKVMAKALGVSEESQKKYSDADIARAQGKTV